MPTTSNPRQQKIQAIVAELSRRGHSQEDLARLSSGLSQMSSEEIGQWVRQYDASSFQHSPHHDPGSLSAALGQVTGVLGGGGLINRLTGRQAGIPGLTGPVEVASQIVRGQSPWSFDQRIREQVPSHVTEEIERLASSSDPIDRHRAIQLSQSLDQRADVARQHSMDMARERDAFAASGGMGIDDPLRREYGLHRLLSPSIRENLLGALGEGVPSSGAARQRLHDLTGEEAYTQEPSFWQRAGRIAEGVGSDYTLEPGAAFHWAHEALRKARGQQPQGLRGLHNTAQRWNKWLGIGDDASRGFRSPHVVDAYEAGGASRAVPQWLLETVAGPYQRGAGRGTSIIQDTVDRGGFNSWSNAGKTGLDVGSVAVDRATKGDFLGLPFVLPGVVGRGITGAVDLGADLRNTQQYTGWRGMLGGNAPGAREQRPGFWRDPVSGEIRSSEGVLRPGQNLPQTSPLHVEQRVDPRRLEEHGFDNVYSVPSERLSVQDMLAQGSPFRVGSRAFRHPRWDEVGWGKRIGHSIIGSAAAGLDIAQGRAFDAPLEYTRNRNQQQAEMNRNRQRTQEHARNLTSATAGQVRGFRLPQTSRPAPTPTTAPAPAQEPPKNMVRGFKLPNSS